MTVSLLASMTSLLGFTGAFWPPDFALFRVGALLFFGLLFFFVTVTVGGSSCPMLLSLSTTGDGGA